MSRRLIIGILAVLVIGAIGGTVVLLMDRLGNGDGTTTPFGSLSESDTGGQNVVDPTADTDNDGLINASEAVWGTDPNNPDTDGDGFADGEEVENNHNPTVAGPDDVLPEGFQPGRDITPLSGSGIAIDDLFAENLDLSGGNEHLTEKYRAAYPEEQRTTETLGAFAQQQNIVTKLPMVRDRGIVISDDNSPESISTYIREAGSLDIFANSLLYSEAVTELYTNNNPSTIRGMALVLRLHQDSLLDLSVPPAAVNYHKMRIGYAELLAATYEQMAMYANDPVKSVVGVRQLEAIDGTYYSLLVQEVSNLRKLSQ